MVGGGIADIFGDPDLQNSGQAEVAGGLTDRFRPIMAEIGIEYEAHLVDGKILDTRLLTQGGSPGLPSVDEPTRARGRYRRGVHGASEICGAK